MIREMIKIDEDKCDGCGLCIPNCHEGALQIIDEKVRLVSDLMCDGLGACLGHCPQGALTIETREAEPYDETKVMELMVQKGLNTVVAHLSHLKDHNETEYFREGLDYIKAHHTELDFSLGAVMTAVHNSGQSEGSCGGGCPGSAAKEIKAKPSASTNEGNNVEPDSQLRQWPVQMHLINPRASYYQNSDLLLAADCTAFSMGNFHSTHLRNKSLAIACPKLDSGQESYLQKLVQLIDESMVNTITVMIMEVPCCGGLLQMAKQAAETASRKVPIKAQTVSIEGEIINEVWL